MSTPKRGKRFSLLEVDVVTHHKQSQDKSRSLLGERRKDPAQANVLALYLCRKDTSRRTRIVRRGREYITGIDHYVKQWTEQGHN